VQTFVVQLRDLDTHLPLPGVRVGDLGKKMGLQGVDNGWIQFDHVRVPRAHMLRRFASVARDGTFTRTHKAQMAYAALIGTRGKLVTLSVGILKRALTIAVRYCGVRRQGEQVNPADPHTETKLLDYQSHQIRLLPALAKAYAYHFQTSYIEKLIEKFDQQADDISEELLADIHGTMAGFKAFCTWDVQAAIEQCRQSCGGNGYSSYTGLEELLANFSVIVTFEGDNTVMALQTANYLVRCVERQRRGETLAGSVQYLDKCRALTAWRVRSANDLSDPVQLLEALDFYAGKQVLRTVDKYLSLEGDKSLPTPQSRWNACQVELIEIARVHVFYNAATRFIEMLQSGEAAQLTPALSALCRLYVLNELKLGSSFLLQAGFMSPAQAQLVHDELLSTCALVRLDAVALVDSFNLSDFVVNSTIGAADGDVYTNMLREVAPRTGVAPYFATAIKPMLEGESLDE
jgi:acyl-CoA oxidase